jgi:hypothetical protein
MHHELFHNSVFEKTEWNNRFGSILCWLNGSCYWTLQELKKQHINHHVHKVDYENMGEFLKWIERNMIFKQLFVICEYFYFPINAYLVHWRSTFAPWWKDERRMTRTRTFVIIIIRMIYFYSLYYIRGSSIIIRYLIAYSMSIQVLRFTDTFSHDYEVVPAGTPTKYLSKEYDMLHTYSTVWETNEQTPIIIRWIAQFIHISFFLNFNFHNQHHYATQKKWFQLGSSFRAEDDDRSVTINYENHNDTKAVHLGLLCGVSKKHFTIPMSVTLRAFHTHRLTRLFSLPGRPIFDPITEQLSLDNCYGITDAPLLALAICAYIGNMKLAALTSAVIFQQ